MVTCALCAATAAAILLMIPSISPDPAVDVVTVEKEAAASLRAGRTIPEAKYANVVAERREYQMAG